MREGRARGVARGYLASPEGAGGGAPQDLELFPREKIVPDSSGAAAAECRALGGTEITGRARVGGPMRRRLRGL